MKKAIVFAMVLAVFLMTALAAELDNNPSTQVSLEISNESLEKFNIAFTKDAVTSLAAASTADNVGSIPMTIPDAGATEVSEEFNLVWYIYSTSNLGVEIAIGPMKDSGTNVVPFGITPVTDSTNRSGTENTAINGSEITAPGTSDGEPEESTIVTVATATGGKMAQSYGNVKLTGTVDLVGAVPASYSSVITTTVTSD